MNLHGQFMSEPFGQLRPTSLPGLSSTDRSRQDPGESSRGGARTAAAVAGQIRRPPVPRPRTAAAALERHRAAAEVCAVQHDAVDGPAGSRRPGAARR